MTREEAKSCIQTIELLRRLAFNVHGVMDVIDAGNCDKIISMLSQEPCGDCIYCHEDSDGYVKPIEKNSHAFIRLGMDGWEISLSAKGWNGSAKIMYCPMCGRKLMSPR